MSAVQQENGPASLSPVERHCRRRKTAALTIVAGCALAGMLAVSVHAADDAGIHDFIRSQARQSQGEAAPRWPSAYARTPAPRPHPVAARALEPAPRQVREPALRHTRALARALAREPRARFASLPRVEEPPMRKAKSPPVASTTPSPARPLPRPVAAGSDPIAPLLRDPTLRPGDIVAFPDGLRVFKGDRALPHRADTFESVEHSRLVSKASRKAVLALTRTVADPGKEARRYLPSAPSSAAPTAPHLEARSEAVRVVYPMAPR